MLKNKFDTGNEKHIKKRDVFGIFISLSLGFKMVKSRLVPNLMK